MYHLKSSNMEKLLSQAQLEMIESDPGTPRNEMLGKVTIDWPSVTILKRELVFKPAFELLHSRVDHFDELRREIEDIKQNNPVKRLPRKSIQVCINARAED